MSYIGQRPVVGRYIKLDQISSGFNGSNTGFSMTAGSQAVFPGTARNLLLSLGGVIQEPDTDFTISGSTLTFTTAPVANTTFFGVIYGDMQSTGTPSDGTVLPASIATSGNFSFPEVTVTGDLNAAGDIVHIGDENTKIRFSDTDQIKLETAGAQRLKLDGTEVVFNDDGASVDFRVEGDTSTHLLFVDASTDRVGIGTTNPTQRLTVLSGSADSTIAILTGTDTNRGFKISTATENSQTDMLVQLEAHGQHSSQYEGEISLKTGGDHRLRVDKAGNVGIGTTSPSTKLQVSGGHINIDSGYSYQWGDSHERIEQSDGKIEFFTNNGEQMTLSGSNLGIGTTSPAANLHVHTDANGEGVLIKSTGNTSNALTFDANRGTEGVIAAMYGRWNGTTVAQISFISGADGTNKDDGIITFGTESAASNGNVNAGEKMRIDSSGKVGIGSTNPQSMIHVKGNDGALGVDSYPQLTIETGSTDANKNKGGGILFLNYNGSGGTFGGSIQCLKENDSNNNESNYMRFSTRADNGSVTERVRISANGHFRAGPESSSDRTGFRHQLSTESGSSSCLSLQNPNNGDGNQVRLGFFSRNTNNAAVEFARIHMEATETQANSTQCGSLIFQTNVAATLGERVRINSSGSFLVGRTGTINVDGQTCNHVFEQLNSSNFALGVHCNNSTQRGIGIYYTSGKTASDFMFCEVAGSIKFELKGNGGFANIQSNDVNLSDVSVKKNITDAASTIDQVKQWKIKEFHLTDDEDSDDKRFGVVAQDIETVDPKLVTEYGSNLKGVKEQQIYWKAIKSLQEAIAKIETLETKVAALEAA